MKKNVVMSKKAKAIIASAMAMTMAIPSMAMFNKVDVKADVKLPSPIVVYNFEDLAEEGVEVVDNEAKPDVKEETGRIGNVLELKDSIADGGQYTNSEAKVKNPYVGREDLLEEPQFAGSTSSDYPIWEQGVTISYWQKAAAVDSATISFTSTRENVVQKDDATKVDLIELYKKEPENELFALGTVEDATWKSGDKRPNPTGQNVNVVCSLDLSGKTFKLYDGCGMFVRFNPEYKGDGYYLEPTYITQGGQKLVRQYEIKAIGDPFDITKYDLEKLGTEGSEIRFAPKAEGGLQLNASGSWVYEETASAPMMKGTVDNADALSPQAENYAVAASYILDEAAQTRTHQAEALVNKPAEWHYITRVIKNDSVTTYVDGELKDRQIYTDIWNGAESVYIGKSFNVGWGYYASTVEDEPITINKGNDVFKTADGIGCGGSNAAVADQKLGYNGNVNGMTIMEMLVDGNTTLSFGGHVPNSEFKDAAYYIGTAAGTALDNVAFYDKPLTEEQAKALFELAKTKDIEAGNTEPDDSEAPEPSESTEPGPSDSPDPDKSESPEPPESGDPQPSPIVSNEPSGEVKLGDVNDDTQINLADAQMALRAALHLTTLNADQKAAADVDKDGDVKLKDAQLILRYALHLITSF